jgi:hypothetical protein
VQKYFFLLKVVTYWVCKLAVFKKRKTILSGGRRYACCMSLQKRKRKRKKEKKPQQYKNKLQNLITDSLGTSL